MVTSCDPKSYELAEHFLQDDDVRDLTPVEQDARTMRLALAIQQAVEDWTEDEAARMREQEEHDEKQRRLHAWRGTDAERERI